MDAYTAALCKKIQACQSETIDTIYFGGGTPSLLGGSRLAQILNAVRTQFTLADHTEITVECNPDSIDRPLLQALHTAGVNRLSIGVQSAHEDELRLLGRRHTYCQAQSAIKLAQSYGFDNLALDLMYGLPGQTTAMLLESAEQLLAFQPAHLSCYGLKLEEGTPLFRAHPILPEEDEQAETYLALCRMLAAAGFEHYEISNFCRPGKRARHNSKYWDFSEYLGLGAAAHSFYHGKRFAYPQDTEAFIRGNIPVLEEPVNSFDTRAEYIMLRLRTAEGLCRTDFEQRFGDFSPIEHTLLPLQAHGLTICDEAGCRLTERGFLVSNAIICLLV